MPTPYDAVMLHTLQSLQPLPRLPVTAHTRCVCMMAETSLVYSMLAVLANVWCLCVAV